MAERATAASCSDVKSLPRQQFVRRIRVQKKYGTAKVLDVPLEMRVTYTDFVEQFLKATNVPRRGIQAIPFLDTKLKRFSWHTGVTHTRFGFHGPVRLNGSLLFCGLLEETFSFLSHVFLHFLVSGIQDAIHLSRNHSAFDQMGNEFPALTRCAS